MASPVTPALSFSRESSPLSSAPSSPLTSLASRSPSSAPCVPFDALPDAVLPALPLPLDASLGEATAILRRRPAVNGAKPLSPDLDPIIYELPASDATPKPEHELSRPGSACDRVMTAASNTRASAEQGRQPGSVTGLVQSDLPPTKKRKTDGDSASGGMANPSKKARTVKPRVRITRHLDLPSDAAWLAAGSTACPEVQRSEVETLLKVLRQRRKIVVIAGAGISVSAGIPDFRSKSGLFSSQRNDDGVSASGKHLFDASVYRSAASISSFHDMVRTLAQVATTSEPTPFHHLLATLAHEGRLLRLYSQNVDGLEAGLPPLATAIPLGSKAPWPKTIQVHGGLSKMVCQKCGQLSDFNPSLFDGPEPPSCPECEQLDDVRTNVAGKRSHGVGTLRPRLVLYNEYNPDEEAIGAVTRADLRARPDAIIVVGTSLKVRGVRRIVKEMCKVVRGRRDGEAIWINAGPVPKGKEFGECWDLAVRADSDVVARLADLGRWNDPVESAEVADEDWARIQRRESPKVVVESPSKARKADVDDVDPADLTRAPTPTPLPAPAPGKKPRTTAKAQTRLAPPTKPSAPKAPRTTKAKAKAKTKAKEAAASGTAKITSVFKTTKAAVSNASRVPKKALTAAKVDDDRDHTARLELVFPSCPHAPTPENVDAPVPPVADP
ncbi:MAG: hypothetical protein M1826_006950 [Phylliscum demangeonii]|nr:MAG: hypothetical protein M1826_006950 [Phylliscum demangeonii]